MQIFRKKLQQNYSSFFTKKYEITKRKLFKFFKVIIKKFKFRIFYAKL